jgi:hypothetical protein
LQGERKGMIHIKKAYWKNKSGLLDKYEISAIVLEQDGIYFDPSDVDFLDKVFKEYVVGFLKEDEIALELSKENLFFYGENSSVYFLNYIYNDFFPNKQQNPFNPILEDIGESEKINLHLFNGFDEQVVFLVEILEKMDISFDELNKKYTLLSFPNSLECYGENIVYNIRYEEWRKRC